MTQITRSDVLAMIARVGAKLDIPTIDASSTPTNTQVIQWLDDAVMKLAKMLPSSKMGSLTWVYESDSITANLNLEQQSPVVMRVFSAKKFGYGCKRYELDEFEQIKTKLPMLHTQSNPAFAVSGVAGELVLMFYPESPGACEIRVAAIPTSYTSIQDEFSAPLTWEDHIVDFAVLQGKIQDEEPEQTSLLLQEWMASIQVAMQLPSLGVDNA